MLTKIIIYYFLFLCSAYVLYRILPISNPPKIYFGLTHALFTIYSLLLSFLNDYSFYRIIGLYVFLIILVFLTTKISDPYIFSSSFAALGISFSSCIISGFTICPIFLLFFKKASLLPYTIIYLLIGIYECVLTFFLMKSQRFTKGVSRLIKYQKTSNSIIIFFLIILTIVLISENQNNTVHFTKLLTIIILLFFTLLFLFYWRYHITQTYREKLRLANQKSLENELNSKTQEISRLKADNEQLASIVHRDNKLIPAMEQAVMDYLKNSHSLSPIERKEIGHSLGVQLHSMALERHGVLSSSSNTSTSWAKSGLHTVDGMLSFMETRCDNENITYKVQIEENITELIRNTISEEDLLHLLGDLIDNAIIATRPTNDNRTVGIRLGSLQKHFLLEIADSGIPFMPEVYQYFGNKQHTTHPSEGGSGIGLMDIYAIKRKYKASLQICEYSSNIHTYSKKITFIFDKKNHFLVQTYRYHELVSTLTRGDIYVFPYESE